LFCSFFVLGSVIAQVSPANQSQHFQSPVFGLGLSASMVSGFGISFRQHFPSELSYQVVGGIIKTDTHLHYNLGGELQYDVFHGEATRFYTSGGLGYFYSGEEGNNSLSAPLRIGIGIGGEWSNLASFHFASALMFTYFSDGTVLPLPQISAHYYFF
jgi:hypothetical protein